MELMRKNYRFSCDCPYCDIRQSSSSTSSDSTGAIDDSPLTEGELRRIAESDARREMLASWIFTHLGYKKWSTDLCREDDLIIREHQEALALVELEGVQSLQNLFIEEIAMAYATLGNVNEFRRWGQKLVQLSRVEDRATARKFENWLEDPQKKVKKWAWRKMQKERE